MIQSAKATTSIGWFQRLIYLFRYGSFLEFHSSFCSRHLCLEGPSRPSPTITFTLGPAFRDPTTTSTMSMLPEVVRRAPLLISARSSAFSRFESRFG